jgi:hypothetical protein
MGGMGSGRTSGRAKIGGIRSLDVNKLNRDGVLSTGKSLTSHWSLNGQPFGSVGIRGGCDQITIYCRYQAGGGPWENLEQTVPILWKPCRYGGQRPYFMCTGQVRGVCCHRPAIKLYGAGKYFFCRRCYRLAYASQSETYHDRALRRAQAIRTKLGGTANMSEPFPKRPKGMWRKTYQRHLIKADEADDISTDGLVLACQRIMKMSQKLRSGKGKFWR